MARELRGKDITVNAVAPGPTATPLFLDGKDQQAIDHLAKAAPLDRLGTPADIAEAVACASSGFGALTARALADADGGAANIVYAGMRDTNGRNAPQVQGANDYAAEHGADLRAIELDVNSE